MKILFANPPWWPNSSYCGVRSGSRWPHTYKAAMNAPGRYVFGEYLPYPFFMAYAASYARRALACTVVLRDSIAMRETYESFLAYVAREDFDFIVIETATPSWAHDHALIKTLALGVPRSRVILTGTIASGGLAQQVLGENVCAVVKGEYEKGVVEVVNGARGLLAHNLLTTAEMNAAPLPDMPQETWDHYCDHNPHGQLFPHAQIWTSRGCPYKCIFCVWPATMTNDDPDGSRPRRVRYYSPDYMRAYLRDLLARHPFRSLYVDDDTFNLGDKHTLAMCEVFAETGLPWSAMCRADTVSRETWKAMKDAGCFGVKIGLESGSQYVVENIVNKRLDLEAARETIHHLKEIGMTVHGTFTIGLPGETPEQVNETLRYMQSLPLDSHQLSGTAEIEGTPLENLRTRGHLDAYPAARMDGYAVDNDGGRKAREIL